MYNFIKSVFDFILSIILMILLSPAIFVISVAIFFDLGFPVFFKQKRGGYRGKAFNIIKFRTMKNIGDTKMTSENDKKRLTAFGLFLRKYSIDELPTLINILKGDMSFVGPRPLIFEYEKLYNDQQKKRFLVKPGITGWAQVNGRNKISWQKKFELDIWYVDNRSILIDLKIIFITISKIFFNKDVQYSNTDDIRFKGNDDL